MGQWTIRVRCLYFVCSVIFLGTRLPVTADHLTRPGHLISHDFVKAIQPQHAETFFSPDKRYKVRVGFDCDDENMAIYQREYSGEYRPITGYIHELNGFMWLPGHPHTLVWATYNGAGAAALSLFDGTSGIHRLKRAAHPDSDSYRCYGYVVHSHEIVYGYSEHYVPQFTKTAVNAAEARLKVSHYMFSKIISSEIEFVEGFAVDPLKREELPLGASRTDRRTVSTLDQ